MTARIQPLATRLWGVLLLLGALTLAVRAYSPLSRLWSTADTSQPGQITVYNSVPQGGKDGLPVEIGDYDADGFQDLVIAPMAANAEGEARKLAGEVYVLRGNGTPERTIDRALPETLPPTLTIWGAREGDYLGTEIFTADVTGDGVSDLLLSAQNFDGFDQSRDSAGGIFLLPGRPGLLDHSRVIDLKSPPEDLNITRISGPRAGERFGIWVEAGDLDGDGFADILAGSDQAPANVNDPAFHSGLVTVIYGRQSFPPTIDLAEPFDGVSVIAGEDSDDHFGSTLHARDLNGDGRADLIASASLFRLSASRNPGSLATTHSFGAADGPGNVRPDCGQVYVIFGPAGGGRLPARLELSLAPPPELEGRITRIFGASPGDVAGEEVTTGDFNGDGRLDLVVGALMGRNTEGVLGGAAHVIYWQPGLEGATLDLREAVENGATGGATVSTLFGLRRLDILGDTLSAGDFNHDGIDDLACGIPRDVVEGKPETGSVAVVLGRSAPWPRVWFPQAEELPPELEVDFILGAQAMDLLSYSMEARDVDNDGYADVYPNAMHGDGGGDLAFDAGEAYVISGYRLTGEPVQLLGVTPGTGFVGESTHVVLEGTGFTTAADTRVLAGGVEAQIVGSPLARRIEALLPPGAAPGKIDLRLENRYGSATLPAAFEYLSGDIFLRGDSNLDGFLGLSDAVHVLQGLFSGGAIPCPDASDSDDNGRLEITDAIFILGYLFLGSRAPAAPFPAPGQDPTADGLSCR